MYQDLSIPNRADDEIVARSVLADRREGRAFQAFKFERDRSRLGLHPLRKKDEIAIIRGPSMAQGVSQLGLVGRNLMEGQKGRQARKAAVSGRRCACLSRRTHAVTPRHSRMAGI